MPAEPLDIVFILASAATGLWLLWPAPNRIRRSVAAGKYSRIEGYIRLLLSGACGVAAIALAIDVFLHSPKLDHGNHPPDMTGTWVVDQDSFRLPSIKIKGLPEGFPFFALTVNSDGTFQALHVPEHFFFGQWPAQERLTGTWAISFKDDVYSFSLHLRQADGSQGEWSAPIFGYRWGIPPTNIHLPITIMLPRKVPGFCIQFNLIKRT